MINYWETSPWEGVEKHEMAGYMLICAGR